MASSSTSGYYCDLRDMLLRKEKKKEKKMKKKQKKKTEKKEKKGLVKSDEETVKIGSAIPRIMYLT